MANQMFQKYFNQNNFVKQEILGLILQTTLTTAKQWRWLSLKSGDKNKNWR